MAKSKATQDFVPVREVRDGIVVLEDGSLRGVIMASSVNFALKSDDERTSILLQFQNFLNTLDFSIQIFIESRRFDIKPYLALLDERKKTEVNDLLKIQITEYIEFVKNFTDNSSIMTKNFFVIVPYTPALLQTKNKSHVFKKHEKKDHETYDTQRFEERRTQLEQRLAIVEQGLARTGIRVARLDNDAVTELFYRIFNPGSTEQISQLQQ